jgi:hypothetical protein
MFNSVQPKTETMKSHWIQQADQKLDHETTSNCLKCPKCGNTGKILIGYYNWSTPDLSSEMYKNCRFCNSNSAQIAIIEIVIGD